MVTHSFKEQLETVRGKVRHIDMGHPYERKRMPLLYYYNSAERMNKAALLLWEHDRTLRDVFAMLAGLSIELLLKGILMGLQEDFPNSHDLPALCSRAGIALDASDTVILQALTEHVIWASKYPTPKNLEHLIKANETFDKQRRKSGSLADFYIQETDINLTNYERLWGEFMCRFFKVQQAVVESA